jgi:hypothetical protein
MMNSVEIKINKASLRLWQDFVNKEKNEIDNRNMSKHVIQAGIYLGVVGISTILNGIDLVTTLSAFAFALIASKLLGSAIERGNEYYMFENYHKPKRAFLSHFVCCRPEEPMVGLLDITKIINEGISTGPWDPRGPHRFRVTEKLDELILHEFMMVDPVMPLASAA